MLDPQFQKPGVFCGAGRADNARTLPATQLDGSLANSPGGRMDQHDFARFNVRQLDEQQPRGQIINGNRGRFIECQFVRDPHRCIRRNDHRVAVAAKARKQSEHANTFGDVHHIVTDSVHDARNLVADDSREVGCVRVQANSNENICKIDAGSMHPHANFARTRNRVVSFLKCQDTRCPVPRHPDLLHPYSLRLIRVGVAFLPPDTTACRGSTERTSCRNTVPSEPICGFPLRQTVRR